MFRVGLTGGIASGKSTVAQHFAEAGALVIDADMLARAVVELGTGGLAAIVERFSDSVLRPDGTLDRAALGQIVFSDAAARADLNRIVHPRVRQLAAAIEAACPDPYAIVIHVIPLLVETGQADDFDAVVVVDVPAETQLERLMARDGFTHEEATARLAAQADRVERLRHADFVIANDGAEDEVGPRCAAVWHGLQHLQHHASGC